MICAGTFFRGGYNGKPTYFLGTAKKRTPPELQWVLFPPLALQTNWGFGLPLLPLLAGGDEAPPRHQAAFALALRFRGEGCGESQGAPPLGACGLGNGEGFGKAY